MTPLFCPILNLQVARFFRYFWFSGFGSLYLHHYSADEKICCLEFIHQVCCINFSTTVLVSDVVPWKNELPIRCAIRVTTIRTTLVTWNFLQVLSSWCGITNSLQCVVSHTADSICEKAPHKNVKDDSEVYVCG